MIVRSELEGWAVNSEMFSEEARKHITGKHVSAVCVSMHVYL